MPRIVIDAGDYSGVAPAAGFGSYDGPTPPKGSYRCKTGLFRLVKNSNQDYMFKVVFEIAEPKASEKSKYNGYAIWHNANVTQVGAPFLNAMLDALGLSKAAVWKNEGGGIVTAKDKPQDVLKIGGTKVRGIEVLVTTKRENYPVGSDEWKLAASSFATAPSVSETSDGGDADADEDDDEDGVDTGSDNEDSADDDDDDDDDNDAF